MNHFKPIGLLLLLVATGCGSSAVRGGSGGTPAAGGALATGGTAITAGTSGSGGSAGVGGRTDTAGAPGSGGGGRVSAGGTTGTGGGASSGGVGGTGGTMGTGGTRATGGAGAAAGRSGAGGATGSGGERASGGGPGTGGARQSGGAPGTGGAAGAGGTSGLGGSSVDGGATGLPYKGVASCTCAERTSLRVSWYYNWTWSPDNCTTGGDFVPMYSNKPNNHPTPEAVATQIAKLASAGYKYVLGFNEPNKTDQANMTVDEAIALWPAMTSSANLLVGSPATSADGKTWFTDFMSQVESQGLRVDFIALHWYGWNAGSCDAKAANLESYIKWAEGLPGNRPLWLTEWGCMNASNPDAATVQAFFAGAVAMFAKHPRLERYAWYQWDPYNELTNADHSLTELGTVYAAQPSTR